MKKKNKRKLYKKLVVGGYGTSSVAQDAFDEAELTNQERTGINSNVTGVGSKVASAFGPIGMVVGAGLTMGSKLEEGDTAGGDVASSILAPNIAKMGYYNRDRIKEKGALRGGAESILNYSTSGIYGKLQNRKERKELESEALREELSNTAVTNYQTLLAEGYDPKGNAVNLYKNGGKLYKRLKSGGTIGGNINKLSEENSIVEGNTHSEGGVKIPELGVELEDKETINNNFVFSDKLGFAKKHKSIAKTIGKLEKRPQNIETKNTLNILKAKEESLKVAQESIKQMSGIENDLSSMKNGGKLYKKFEDGGTRGFPIIGQESYADYMSRRQQAMDGYADARLADGNARLADERAIAMEEYMNSRSRRLSGNEGSGGYRENPVGTNIVEGVQGNMSTASDKPETNNFLNRDNVNSVLAYSDNIANVILNTSKANRKIPKAELTNYIKPVRYDLSASKTEADNQLRGFNKAVERSNTNQGAVNANRAAGLAKTIGAKNAIIESEENLNKQEIARARQINTNIESQNKNINFNNKMLKLKIKDDLLNESSANIANATNKFMWYNKDRNMQDRAKEQQLVDIAAYSPENRDWVMKEVAKSKAKKKLNGGKLYKKLK